MPSLRKAPFISKDPFHREILEALEREHLDGQLFERAMADVLRQSFPTLVPVSGGSDEGQDGAIADGEAEAFSLICTTAQDALRNLRRSLDQLIQAGKRRKVVFVTSQALTPKRRRNLEKAAVERGVTLVQVIDRDGVADHLYWDSTWLKSLLNLRPGRSALSTIPKSRRPQLGLPLIGRDRDLDWLREQVREGRDCLLSGEPGSGKTFLLRELVRLEEGCYFLVDEDREALANALRQFQPRAVIVDDAHVKLETLDTLRHRRDESGQGFALVASSWKGGAGAVDSALGGNVETRALELLTRSEIDEIFKSAPFFFDPSVRQLLVEHAANKPGLAVTQGQLWLQGFREKVWNGEALRKDLIPAVESLTGQRDGAEILAVLSLSGDSGFTTEEAGELLGRDRLELRRELADLAAGGVLSERGAGRLAVWPRVLRSPLIREVFAPDEGPRLRIEDYLTEVPDDRRSQAVQELLLAKLRGVPIPRALLFRLVREGESEELWALYARHGQAEAKEALDQWPADAPPKSILKVAIEEAPRQTLDRLLDLLPGSHTAVALSVLEGWVSDPLVVPKERTARRRSLLQTLDDVALPPLTILRVLKPAVEPVLEARTLVGNVLHLEWRSIAASEIEDLEEIWEKMAACLEALEAEGFEALRQGWQTFQETLGAWRSPQAEPPKGGLDALVQILSSNPVVQRHVGMQRLVGEYSQEMLPEATELDELFPRDPEKINEAIESLAKKWAGLAPREVVPQWTDWRQEARFFFGHDNSMQVAQRLAREIHLDQLEDWLKELTGEELEPSLVAPFAQRLLEVDEDRMKRWGERWLHMESPGFSALGLSSLFCTSKPEKQLISAVLGEVGQLAYPGRLFLPREISRDWLRILLLRSPPSLKFASAIEIYERHPELLEDEPELRQHWREVLLSSAADPELVGQGLAIPFHRLLEEQPELGLSWLKAFLEKSPRRIIIQSYFPYLVMPQIQRLDTPGRIDALSALEAREEYGLSRGFEVVQELVNDDPVVYQSLLDRQNLARFHLYPLHRTPDEAWWNLSKMALEAGVDEDSIVMEAVTGEGARSILSEETPGYLKAFQGRVDDSDPDLQSLAQAGVKHGKEFFARDRERKRHYELHGL